MHLGMHPDAPRVAPLAKPESYFFALKIHIFDRLQPNIPRAAPRCS